MTLFTSFNEDKSHVFARRSLNDSHLRNKLLWHRSPKLTIMENQLTRPLTTKKVIEDFKAKKEINLSEEEAEKYIDLIYSFSEQAFKLYNASKTCNPVEFNSIEPKKAENINYNLFAKKVLVRQV